MANVRLRSVYVRNENGLSYQVSSTSDETLVDEERPLAKVLLSCIAHPRIGPGWTNEMIATIAARWRRYRVFRELYLDDEIYAGYVQFREFCEEGQELENCLSQLKPGIDTSHRGRGQPVKLLGVDKDFKTRFYKCLCLLSMSVASHHLGMMSSEGQPSEAHELEEVWDVAHAMWTQSEVFCNGGKNSLSLEDQIQGLELFDFIYCFLLRKILPPGKSHHWVEACGDGDWPLSRLDEWSDGSYLALLHHCSYTLDLLDILDMIRHRAWSDEVSFPPNLTSFMRSRGMFDLGNDAFDWFTGFERKDMIQNLKVPGIQPTFKWWDALRRDSGSPFLPSFSFNDLSDDQESESSLSCGS